MKNLSRQLNLLCLKNSPAGSAVVADRFLYAPAMVGVEDFDKQFKLPKQKKTKKTNLDIQTEKQLLETKLAENTHSMNQIKTGSAILKKAIKKN